MYIAKITLTLMTAVLLGTTPTLTMAQECNPNMVKTKPDTRYVYNAAGDWVTDTATGLTWKRCVEGMHWTGETCEGRFINTTWNGALEKAAAQPGWRLPNVKELESLLEGACYDNSINEKAFPGTPGIADAWSATPVVRIDYLAWAVDFGGGRPSWGDKLDYNYYHSVRLVRGP
ncbi:MAG: DUF1566 domain-containing protein [Pseudomonadota bacterium]